MEIRLKPELEKLVEQDVRRGPYQSANEFVERAVVMLHEQESWLAERAKSRSLTFVRDGDEIRAQIDEGYAAAKRGELMDAEEARRSMERRKSALLADQPKK
jgi:Arc/MetJ-type ribon-helix-helix transcriptional regulator